MNMSVNKSINIMTSCDENLAKQLPVLLQSIADSLSDKMVHFYLFHSTVKNETISFLQKFCECYKNMIFHEIVVPNPEDYVKLARRGGGWNGEAYYSLCAHQLLPEDVDRILYLDAGDVIVAGNIDEYYFGDFEGHALLVTAACYKLCGKEYKLFEADDMANPELLKCILRGLFNSGSYVINLNKIREDGYTMADFLYLSERLSEVMGTEENVYFGDQGLIAAAFVGDIKYFHYPKIINMWYMPYNFCLWYFNAVSQKPNYKTSIIHYAGGEFKPWKGKYEAYLPMFQKEDELIELDRLKAGQAEYYQMWYEYARKAETVLKENVYSNDNLPSYKELADIFKQDISEQEFMEIWKTIESSVKAIPASVSVLEGLAYFDDDFIMENRFFWGDIFELAEDLGYILQNDLFSDDEKECLFNKAFEEAFFQGLDEDSIKILRSIFDVEEKPLEIRRYGKQYYSFEAIFQKFKILLEHDNEFWADYLRRAAELKPDDEDVVASLHKYSVFS